jgi:hypothetical protein
MHATQKRGRQLGIRARSTNGSLAFIANEYYNSDAEFQRVKEDERREREAIRGGACKTEGD